MKASRRRSAYALAIGSVVVATGVFATDLGGKIVRAGADAFASSTVSFERATSTSSASPEKPKVAHIATPASVRAIYMTQCVVGTPSFRSDLVKLIDTTELNAVVIDIKDYTGRLAFTPEDPSLKDSVSPACRAPDMREFIKGLHEKNIYVIGRITVFQDPYYTALHPDLAVKRLSNKEANWKDHKGLSFIDVSAKPYWDYIVKIANASYEIGFDELNFDYIRFPSDGNMKDTFYTWNPSMEKSEALERFYMYLHDRLKPTPSSAKATDGQWAPVMSVDLFGMVTTNYDDLNIGQVLERAMPYFDFIDPMVYPSHYPVGFNGYKNVNEHSYDIVHFSLAHAVERTVATTTQISALAFSRIGTSTPAMYAKPTYPASKIRPWLQSFDYPVAYTPEMVSAQIKANTDAGLNAYLFWDPANKYRSLRAVLQSE
ncbi:MAG: putative glycoside hydrolase [Candidatus Kaiserbacteria bacterium]|nr:putative glycoside hydrolase [Candidatus Kaiserbacteria bacterium]